MSTKRNVLVPDGASTWALSVIQCLSQASGYRIFVISNEKRTASKYSKYTSYYKYYKRTSEAAWLDILKSEIELNSIAVIIPIAEEEISFLIKNKEKISSLVPIIPLPEFKDFEIAVNKKLLSDFAVRYEIPHPKSNYIPLVNGKHEVPTTISFPTLIKPLRQKGGDGIQKIKSKAEFDTYVSEHTNSVFTQEYIEGYDIDCSVLCLDGNVLTNTIQIGSLKGHNDFAPQLGFDFLYNSEVLSVVQDTMSKLNWSGVAHLDLRYDKHTKDYKLIEINARFWGSIEASVKAGVNFPDLAIRLALGEPIDYKGYKPIKYMRLKGVVKTIKRYPGFIFKRQFLLNHTEVKSFLSDPLPTLYKFREWVGRQFHSKS